ncbi:MAG: TIGR02281 family clan AA aspartic protease [Proteobacteria bacterium]|nr:TIGR02281 family clan AA aspartic protease [Pseudomonadota bacterium]MCK4867275.1 TIGR02281 family clan AA aspartic protease [Alphaproteobacteria bacterium]
MVQTPPPSPRGTGPNRWFWFLTVAVGLTGLVVWLIGRYPNALDSRDAMINITRYGAILLLVASGILGSRTMNVKKAVRDIAIWVAILAGLVALYGFRYELETLGLRIAGELEPSRGNQTTSGEMLYRRSADGHFYIDATVNRQLIRFLVDTGASDIVLSPADAERAGFNRSELLFNQQYQTANGIGWGAPVVLRSIQAGTIRFNGVAASVNDAPMSESLLGMSFLDRLSGFEVRGDSLILRP